MNKLIAAGMMALGVLTGTLNAAEPVKIAKGEAVVVYFSWSPDGNTRFAAKTIAAKLGAQTFEIKAAKAYSSDYRTCLIESKPECYAKKQREIHLIEGLELAKYKVIFVGTPNWWGTMAPPVRTWIMQNSSGLNGKTVCLFQTHGGGGMQRVEKEFSELVPHSNILPAQAFFGSTIKDNVKELEKFVTDRVMVK